MSEQRTDRERLAAIRAQVVAATRVSNQVSLTPAQAEGRKEWRERWDELRAYAGKVALTYCQKRGLGTRPDIVDEIRDDSLGQAWRSVCRGESAEKAIRQAVSEITWTRYTLRKQSHDLPDLEDVRQHKYGEWDRVQWVSILRAVGRKLRPLARLLASEPDASNPDLAHVLECSEKTIRNYRKQIAQVLFARRIVLEIAKNT